MSQGPTVQLGDQILPFPTQATMTAKQLAQFEDTTGWTYAEWGRALEEGRSKAFIALWWAATGMTTDFDDVDFVLGDLIVTPAEGGDAGPQPALGTAPSASTEGAS